VGLLPVNRVLNADGRIKKPGVISLSVDRNSMAAHLTRRVAANILNKQSWTADKGWSFSLGAPAWGLGEVLIMPPREKTSVKKYSQGEMLPLETKQSGGKLLQHLDVGGGCF